MSKDAKFWDRMAKVYFNKPIKDEEAYQIKLATTQEYFRPDMKLLEIGCGTGGTAIAHAPFVAHITATDFSDRMIGFAEKRKAEVNVENVTFARASVTKSLETQNRYEAVLMLSILHLLEDPQATIQQVAKVLKPGGLLVSNTPCLNGQLGVMGPVLQLGGRLGLVPRTIQEFSETELMSWIADAGFKTIHHWHPEGSETVFTVSQKT